MFVGIAGGPFADEVEINLAPGETRGNIPDDRFHLLLFEIHHHPFRQEEETAVRMLLFQHLHPVCIEHGPFDVDVVL